MKSIANFLRSAVLVVAIAGLGLGFLGLVQRAGDACHSRQRIYDAQFTYTDFLARQFHATPTQTRAAVRELRATVGARPSC